MSDQIAIFRTSRDSPAVRTWITSELSQGRLRQGWGGEGTALVVDGDRVASDEWLNRYARWMSRDFGRADGDRAARVRYALLQRMVDLQEGDKLILPNHPVNGSFTVLSVRDGYRFELDRNAPITYGSDYGHIVEVDFEGRREFSSSESLEAIEVWRRARKQRSCFGFVRDQSISNALQCLLEGRLTSSESMAAFSSLTQIPNGTSVVSHVRTRLIETLTDVIGKVNPHEVEKIVRRAFENAGYKFVRSNQYDRRGGDADIVFESPVPLLTEATGEVLTVYVQVKQRQGIALNDIEGVRQVSKISADNPLCLRVLVSTAEEFDEGCVQEAEELGVVLVSGPQLAEVLMRYL